MLYTECYGKVFGFYPDNELSISSSNDSRLCLNSKTLLLEILQLLDQKSGLARQQGEKALSGFFGRIIEIFSNLQDGVFRHIDTAVIQEGDFQLAPFRCLPLIEKKNRLARFCGLPAASTLDVDGSHKHIRRTDRLVGPPAGRSP